MTASILLALAFSVQAASLSVPQWQIAEFELRANKPVDKPIEARVAGVFVGPEQRRLVIPAFWDGGNVWKIRFAPTLPGTWTYEVVAEDPHDLEFDDVRGSVTALPADPSTRLYRHGGFLRVSDDGHRLAYTDGTPFFWLGDTWWYCPSTICTLEGSTAPGLSSMFRHLVDTRLEQGFTVAQIAFSGRPAHNFERNRPSTWTDADIAHWRSVDGYFRYAADRGLLLAVAMGFFRRIEEHSLEDLKALWRYVVARYGAFPVTWILVGEYNLSKDAQRIAKALDLGAYVKSIDPYRRAMSVHPARYQIDGRQAWNAPWVDFVMVQGGHDRLVPTDFYVGLYDRRPVRPFVESEARYEGILGRTPAADVRLAAYRAIQSGAAGYTYGAQGVWHPAHSANDPGVQRWGGARPWWEALNLPGARQMGALRACYEAVDWWKLAPRTSALIGASPGTEVQRPQVSGDGAETFVIYLPAGFGPDFRGTLGRFARNAEYEAWWCDPRSGSRHGVTLEIADDRASLPTPPTGDDWLLFVRRKAS